MKKNFSNKQLYILELAKNFAKGLELQDKLLRRTGNTIPPLKIKEELAIDFWKIFSQIDQYQDQFSTENLDPLKEQFRSILTPWLCRSRYFWRGIFKPHGYSGDYRMIEWMYDAEEGLGYDSTQPAIVNCLDHIFSTIDSVQSIWDRRKWFSTLLKSEYRKRGNLKILDIACGGARYIDDFLSSVDKQTSINVTLMDQDASALSYINKVLAPQYDSQISTISGSIKNIYSLIPDGDFDLIISAGLFDYLPDNFASDLIQHMANISEKNSVLAISNFHPSDRSASCKDWAADWQIIFRDVDSMKELFPKHLKVQTSRSKNGALTYATAIN